MKVNPDITVHTVDLSSTPSPPYFTVVTYRVLLMPSVIGDIQRAKPFSFQEHDAPLLDVQHDQSDTTLLVYSSYTVNRLL